MKNGKKKKVTRKSEKSKKKERSSAEPSNEKSDKWQEFLRRHSKAQEKK